LTVAERSIPGVHKIFFPSVNNFDLTQAIKEGHTTNKQQQKQQQKRKK